MCNSSSLFSLGFVKVSLLPTVSFYTLSLQEFSLINVSVPFRIFAFLKIFCLSLNRKSLQTIVLDLFLVFLSTLLTRSISAFCISNLSFNIKWTFFSYSSPLSLLSSFTPLILMLFRLGQSSSFTSLLRMFSAVVHVFCIFVNFRNFPFKFANVLLNIWNFIFKNIFSKRGTFFRLLFSSLSFPISCFAIVSFLLIIFDVAEKKNVKCKCKKHIHDVQNIKCTTFVRNHYRFIKGLPFFQGLSRTFP